MAPHRTLIGIAIVLGATTCACDRGVRAPERPGRAIKRVAVIGPGGASPEWDVLHAVAERMAAADAGVRFTYHAPSSRSVTAQRAAIQTVRESDAHSVCLFPADPSAMETDIAGLVVKGKPVVLVGADVPKSNRTVFVGPSEVQLGEALAKACSLVMPRDRETVMLLHAGSDHSTYGLRYAGFRTQLQYERGAKLFKELDCRGDVVEAQRIIRRQSRLYPRLGCWALLDDWPLRRWPSDEAFVPIGCSLAVCRDDPVYFDAMRRGQIDALVSYDLHEAIELALRAAIRIAEDRADEATDRVSIEPEIIVADRLEWHERRWEQWRAGNASPAETSE